MTVALCIEEKEYKERFENCWMHHYKHQYDVYLFSDIQELANTDTKEYEVIVTDHVTKSGLNELRKRGRKIIVLWEKQSDISDIKEIEEVVFVAKYQELYKIEEAVKHQIIIDESSNKEKENNYKVVGVFSLDCERMQMPFAALAACEYGEKSDTLLINLQAYSGFESEVEISDVLRMEDLMTMSATGTFSRERVYGAIGHEQNWDYVYPPRNAEFLSEGDGNLYQKIVELMAKEFGYQTIIINFGAIFSGISELFEYCDEFYLLASKDGSSWRERAFRKDLERKEKVLLIQRIKRIEITTLLRQENQDWRRLMQKWRWSEMGDKLRKFIWEGL